MTVIENKISDFSSLVLKISGIGKKVADHDLDKYITTSEFNNLTVKIFAARLAQPNLITNANFDTKLMKP